MLNLPTNVLLIFTIISCSIVNIIRGVYSKKYSMEGTILWIFNFFQNIFTSLGVLLIFLSSGYDFSFSVYSVLMGIVLALANVFSLEGLLKAQSIGPFTYSILIISLSAILPTFSGLIFFNETIKITQYIGIALMIACIILSQEKSKEEHKTKNLKWLIYCAIAFVFSGTVGIVQKFHQNSVEHKNEMVCLLLTCFFVSSVFSGIKLLQGRKKNKTASESKDKIMYILPIITGLCFAFPHTINLLLSGRLPSVIFFPTVNLCPMILTMLYAVLIYKEKMSAKRWSGIFVGISATVFVSGII